jgi:RimJ/RimL family protein N-acetyltransferase
MKTEVVLDKYILYEFLRKDAENQIYLIGDLDDFFWPHTRWYALMDADEIKAVALLYSGLEIPTLLCFQRNEVDYAVRLLQEIRPLLPDRFYAHLSEGLTDVFYREKIIENYGRNYKMVLRKAIDKPDSEGIRRLSVDDLSEISKFYSVAYPHNWFDSRMLDSGKYFGYFSENVLLGIAGIHVYSPQYKVAALGNIATNPVFRNQKIGSRLTSFLCHDLQQQQTVKIIGLNVNSDNESAIRLYKKLGFEMAGCYEECFIRK